MPSRFASSWAGCGVRHAAPGPLAVVGDEHHRRGPSRPCAARRSPRLLGGFRANVSRWARSGEAACRSVPGALRPVAGTIASHGPPTIVGAGKTESVPAVGNSGDVGSPCRDGRDHGCPACAARGARMDDGATSAALEELPVTDNAPATSGDATTYDLVILGGGSGGYACALRAAELGFSVALVEKREARRHLPPPRGASPRRPCSTPARSPTRTRESEQFGVKATFEGVDIAAGERLQGRRRRPALQGPPGFDQEPQDHRRRGHGRLVAPTTVEVEGTAVEGRYIVLATGSSPEPAWPRDRRQANDHQRACAGAGAEPARRRSSSAAASSAASSPASGSRSGPRSRSSRRCPTWCRGGRGGVQDARAGLPQAQDRLRARRALRRRREDRDRHPGPPRERQEHRRRPDAGRGRARTGLP